MSEDIRIKSFTEFLAKKPKSFTSVRCYTKDEFCEEVCPIIRQEIDRLLNPSDDDGKDWQQVAEDLKECVFEWEVIGFKANE